MRFKRTKSQRFLNNKYVYQSKVHMLLTHQTIYMLNAMTMMYACVSFYVIDS